MQVPLEELLALTAALESNSEHPLASSVLNFAESVISAEDMEDDRQEAAEREASTSETSWLKGGETEMLVLAPKGNGPLSSSEKGKRRTAWLRPAKDVESKAGEILAFFSGILPQASAEAYFLQRRW